MELKIIKEIRNMELTSRIIYFNVSETPLHWHENYELCQVIKNSCKFLIDGKLIEANEGDIVSIPEYIEHSFIIENDDTHIRVLQFPLKILLNFNTTIESLKTHITNEEINSNPDVREKLDSILKIMEQEGNALYINSNPFLQSIFAAIYFLLMRDFALEEKQSSVKKERKEFHKIVDYVNEHFNEDINVKTVASNLYISRGRLTSLFAKYSSTGLNDYINALRIKKANELLLDGHRITEAAIESGYQSIRTFNNVYKSYMGITPTEYVKKHTNTK